MKTLTTALLVFAALLGPNPGIQGLAAAPGPNARIAYEQCGPDLGYWIVTCQIYMLVNGSYTWVAPGVGPRWSPDGSRLVFTGANDGYGTVSFALDEVVVANLADGSVANLTNHPARDISPAWSTDGGRIAFVSDRDGSRELYVMSADGSNLTRVTHSPGFTGSFVWVDGGRIVFANDGDGVPDLYVTTGDGSNRTRLTQDSGFQGQLVSSRDGTRIAFACERESGNGDICAIDSDGTNFVRLTTDPAFDSSPSFSPIDSRIAFTTGHSLAVMDTDGSVTLVGDASSQQPAWSADATQLAFVGTTTSWLGRCYFGGGAHPADDFCMPVEDIYVVNVDGTGLTLIANGGSIEWFTPTPGRPLATFTYDCTGSTCQFDASGSTDSDGIITSYAWSFGDGTTGSGATTGHTYSAGRRFDVTLTVTDDAGLTGTLTLGVNANVLPVASFTAACQGATCVFDTSASFDPDGAIVAYYWNFGDGHVGESAMPTHTYATAGTFTVTLGVWDNSGIGSIGVFQSNVTIASVNAPPLASFTSTCTAVTCTLDASGSLDSDGTIASYAWSFGDGTGGSGAAVSHTYATSGTYTVSLTVTDNAGATGTRTQNVTVLLTDMHVGDLDGSSTSQQNRWTATVTITVHDIVHAPVEGVVVTGAWSDGAVGSCTTNASGRCAVARSAIPKSSNRATFAVTSATRSAFRYIPGGNHDPDGDSNGTTITVRQP